MRSRLLVFVVFMLLSAAGLPLAASYFAVDRLFLSLRDNRLDTITRELLIRHQAFEMILADADDEMGKLLNNALPRIAAVLEAQGAPFTVSPDRLAGLAKQYGIDELYIVDPSGMIRSTSFDADLGFDLTSISPYLRQRIDATLGAGRIVSDPLDVSVNTGELRKYAYYSPERAHFILEGSIEVRNFVRAKHSQEFSTFVFSKLLGQDNKGLVGIADIDLFYGRPSGMWSIIQPGKQLDEQLAAEAVPGKIIEQNEDGHVVRYSFFPMRDSSPHTDKIMAVKVAYTEDELRSGVDAALHRLLWYVGLVGLGGTIAVLWLFQAMVGRPIQLVLEGVRRITDGDYTRAVAVSGPSELAEVARGIDAMQKALADRESKLAEALAQVERMANTDGLTGLANRRQLDAMLERECALANRHDLALSVILFDIDHFKQVNDRFGHQAGDEVLRTLGKLVLARVRATDVAARYGGEEFLLILPGTPLDDATQLAEDLRVQIKKKSISEVGHVCVSLGVAALGQGEEPAQLLSRADEALYAAKKAGRDQVMIARHNA